MFRGLVFFLILFSKEEAAKSLVKTVKFEKLSEEQLFESASLFEPALVASEPAANATSVLANLIKSLPKSVSSKDLNVTRTERVKGRLRGKRERDERLYSNSSFEKQ